LELETLEIKVKRIRDTKGGLIPAIKFYREQVPGTGLAEAKDYVEKL
jgi:ribosomal protein L7/L12